MQRHWRRQVSQAVRGQDLAALDQFIKKAKLVFPGFASLKEGAEGEKDALMIAAEMGWAEGVKLLLGVCDARRATSRGETALSLATLSRGADGDCVRLLARAGDTRGVFQRLTPLQWAAKRGFADKVRALMALSDVKAWVGASEARNWWNFEERQRDALSLAIEGDHLAAAQALAPRSDRTVSQDAPSRLLEAARALAPECLDFFLSDENWREKATDLSAQTLRQAVCEGWREGMGNQPKKSRRQERALQIAALELAALEAQSAAGASAAAAEAMALSRKLGKKELELAWGKAFAKIEASAIQQAIGDSALAGESALVSGAEKRIEGPAPRASRLRL